MLSRTVISLDLESTKCSHIFLFTHEYTWSYLYTVASMSKTSGKEALDL